MTARRHISLHILLVGRTPILLANQPPLNSRQMTTFQLQGMNIIYGPSFTLTVISINMDMLDDLAITI